MLNDLNPVAIIREMRDAGLNGKQIVGEILGAVAVFALPILLMFIGAAFGY